MGFGAEVVAEVAEHVFDALKAPPLRVGAPRIPVPFSEPLENLCRISSAKVSAAARKLVGAAS